MAMTTMLQVAALATLAFSSHVKATNCSGFKVYNDTSCTQPAFKWANVASAELCCETCATTATCEAWEWTSNGAGNRKGNCHLKTKSGPGEYQDGTTCGVANSLPPLPPHPMPPPPPAPLPPKPPAPPGSPNIVWFLTDDQDQKLGGSFPMHNGVGPMPNTKALLADKGATATNWFIHTPICCPSRSELVSGRYFHNIKQTGGGCMHINENLVNNQTFARYLYMQGYNVGMFGKYLNNNPKLPPPGIEAYMTNGGGNYYSPQFDTQGVDDLAPYFMQNGSWQGNASDYTTSVVGNVSMSWLKKVAASGRPFFAYIAPKACHEPFSPATWYEDYWDPSWPAMEPRPVSWNSSFEARKDHHGNVATNKLITDTCADYVTTSFKNRWRSLMSVDDVIASVVTMIEDMGLDTKTYFMYSSDHGFQLGEFNILIDKRQPYDHDTRIHLLMRGPGIAPGSTFPYLGTNVDIAPTWLGLAGAPQPPGMDGRSIVPLVVNTNDNHTPLQTQRHIQTIAPQGQHKYAASWRDSVFIEYYFNDPNTKCKDYPTEDIHNNFIGIRHLANSSFGDTAYYEFQSGDQNNAPGIEFDNVDFIEYYNMTTDNWQMLNLWAKNNSKTHTPTTTALSKKLHMWFECKGDACP